ncbi:alpha/beta fold hydrolase [Intrasporangium sp.]|uniref:alpha/beta fold hydrolase n=1 Tax=Intrasporangium sp. TaxID=1925024 RepID=UPI00293B771D|nr:alpha/beta fold hydrolase [Intrasporangium sp.]MDV3219925.1 alpha/beta fold hydrolase [Intrasporangium sp.]
MSLTRPRRLRAGFVAVGLSLAVTVGVVPAAPGALAAAVRPVALVAAAEDLTVQVGPEPDGTAVTLDAAVWTPAGGGPHPVVLLAHGFGGSKDSVTSEATQLQERGYLVVTWSARGHGASGGRIHLNSPDFEIADARALVDLVAKRSDVLLDTADDPRLGVMGGSYGGALGLMLAGADRRVDAVVAAITWNDLADAFFPQSASTSTGPTPAGREPVGTPGPFKQVWATNFFLGANARLLELPSAAGVPGAAPTPSPSAQGVPPVPSASGQEGPPAPSASGQDLPSAATCGRFDPTICRGFLDASVTGEPSDELVALLRRHSPKPTLPQVAAPTLLVQGIADSLFGLEHADATASALADAGTPVAVRWSDGGHDGPSTREAEETEAGHAWLDHYVKAGASDESALPTAGFTFPTPASRRSQPADLWTLPAYPGLDGAAVTTESLPLAATTGGLLHPPGGQPASMVAVPGFAALGITVSTYQIAALPGLSTSFETQPAPRAVTVAGSPTLTLTVTSDRPTVTLFASLWRVSGEQASLPASLVAPMRVPVTPGRPTTVTVSLPAATYEMPTGSRWRVLLTSTEATYANAREPARIAVEAGAELTVPVVEATPVGVSIAGTDTESALAGGILGALVVLAAGAALWRRRQRRHAEPRPDLAGIPLVVTDLVKSYADGHRAVDGVSWRAEKGQVVGLLGPNGAGKTTTMRMVMGLIAPDTGTVHVLGQPVSAGSDVLERVGALIEGPGFLPHLTGRQNLDAYWAATGRRPEEAHVDEVLEVAALGGAVDRPVRSYSHGMKQRLGIAQAMLGLPELLVLDEPTNGLDPPQIAAMRPILRRYAETGRTVVISSHLLAEVEMTCTHVVVMHAGRVVTEGPVADLVDSDDTTILDLDPLVVETDEDSATPLLHSRLDALRGVDGVTEVRRDTETRIVVVAERPRVEVVGAAVEAGLPVVGVSSRRHLEEVFLGVISSASADSAANGAPVDTTDASLIERLRQVRAR